MKKLVTLWMTILVLGLMSGSAFAQAQFLIDDQNPLYLTLLTVPPNNCQTVAITLDPGGEITTPLITAGCWVVYDPSQVSIGDVVTYPVLWDPGTSGFVREPSGPGTFMFTGSSFGTVRIDLGPVPLCDVEFCCEGSGESQIAISTVPGFDTVVGDTTVWDPDIDDGIINLTVDEDTDSDGIPDGTDNCPTTPNGSNLGTCTEGTVGESCMSHDSCDPNGVCSMNQEDMDLDGVGDVCDDVQMCKGNFDYDGDVDGTDAAVFKAHFGRSTFTNPCPSDGPAPVEKTHQTTSYATGDDGEYQSGVPFPEPRFVDNEDGTIRDNLTGLIWLKNADCFGQRTWEQALSDCNGLANGSCGLTDGSNSGDWRLPNRFELESLLDMDNYDHALPSGHPFTGPQYFFYWSSTTNASDTLNAWGVAMGTGVVDRGRKDVHEFFVWPVRGGH